MRTEAADTIRAVIFDMDGVIFDSERLNVECWVETGAKHHLPDIRSTCMKAIGSNRAATEKLFTEAYGDILPFAQFAEEAYGLFHERYDGRLPVKPGAEELLQSLRDRGVPTALASSTMREMVEKELKDAGLFGYFDQVICGDMVTRSKPDPMIFLAAAKALETEPAACCVIEDSFNGVRAGHAAGMFTIMVPDLLEPTEEIRKLADLVLPSLADVRQFLGG